MLFFVNQIEDMKKILFIISTVLLVACSSDSGKSLPKVFDYNAYISYNIDSLSKLNIPVKKRIVMGDSVENLTTDSLNLKKSLSIFESIKWNNKQALRYRIDSSLVGQRLRIEYKALDTNLSVQRMLIEKLNSLSDLTARVRITRKVDRPIYNLNQEFYFEPATGCFVKGSQEVPNVYDQAYEVYYQWD